MLETQCFASRMMGRDCSDTSRVGRVTDVVRGGGLTQSIRVSQIAMLTVRCPFRIYHWASWGQFLISHIEFSYEVSLT